MTAFHTFCIRICIVSLAIGAGARLSAQAGAAESQNQADVVVYSGVPCGVAAAVAAARDGAHVILVEPTRHVGGLNTSGLNTAETEHMLKWTFGGVAQEFYQRVGKFYGMWGPAYYFESRYAEKVFCDMLAEARVDVRFGARVDRVEKDAAGKISAIVLTDGARLTARVFVDAGYEGDLMARAGISYAVGRESIAEYHEPLAGIRLHDTPRKAATVDGEGNLLPGISGWARDMTEGAADPKVMNYNWRLCFSKDPEFRVPIPAPRHYDRNRYRLLENWLGEKAAAHEQVKLVDILDLYGRHVPGRTDKVEVNNKQAAIISIGHFGGQFDYPDADYAKRDAIIQDHTDYTLGLLHFLAADSAVPKSLRQETAQWGLHKEEFADNGHWPYQLYVREARRMKGAYVMTQKDVQEDRHKPDAIALGSHFIDCHHVQRIALSPTEFVNEGRIWEEGQVYQIPFRAITPKREECTNLLVPGAASFSHVAFCTYRLESTWMMAGHAAGSAAARAAKYDKPVQDLDMNNLQPILRSEGQIIDFLPGQPEKFADAKAAEKAKEPAKNKSRAPQ